jgi:hypothetical protein
MQANGTVPRQLADTIKAYEGYIQRPMIPTGAAFAEHGWTAIPSDQKVFVNEVKKHGLTGCNWWEYYEAFNRTTALGQAIAEARWDISEQEDDEVLYQVKVIVTALNVRTGPGVSYPTAGPPMPKGTVVNVYEERAGWLRIGTGRWCSGHSAYVERITPPAPLTLEERVERLEKAVFK